jgi:DtxR family transcriptional regulator, Mn-dependent transcriptional regulator
VPEGFHPPIEEYLKVIYELEEDGIPVIRARLAERLGHSPPSVTDMVRRLVGEGYLEVHQRALRLTPAGRCRAESVVRKHRLAERLLVDVIGLPWHKAHAEAGHWEHVISEEVEQYLAVLLHHPTTCPHGNPIPGSEARAVPMRALSGARPGEQVRIERMTETVELDLDMLAYLDAHGLRPGTTATVSDRAPDGTFNLDVGGEMVAVSPGLAEELYVAAPEALEA